MRKTKKTQKTRKANNGGKRLKTTVVREKMPKAVKTKSAPKKVQKKSVHTKSSVLKHTKSIKKPTVHASKTYASKKTKNAPKRSSAPIKSKRTSQKKSSSNILYREDLKNLSNGFWGNLDLLCFQQVRLENATADIVYASDDVGIIIKVLSNSGTWQVNTATDTWKNRKTSITSPIAELKKLCTFVKNAEPNSKIIPAIILMRGTIQDEEKVQNYLKKHGVQLIKSDSFKQSRLPALSQLLQANFLPIITSIRTDEDWDGNRAPVVKQVSFPNSRKHLLTQKQTQKLASCIATVARAGYFPVASGTIGSLIALPIAYILNQMCLITMWISILLTMLIGVWAIKRFTQNKVDKDPSSVIIDEVVGQLIPFAFVASGLLHWPILLTGFILFRFFDICKFGLVKYFDRQKNAWGVMLDDVIAGLQTAFILVLLQILYILT